MARREVVEIICDRCGKTETQEPSQIPKTPDPGSAFELTIMFQGESKSYADLCLRCRNACEGYFKSMTKQTEKQAEDQPEPKKPGILAGLGRKTG